MFPKNKTTILLYSLLPFMGVHGSFANSQSSDSLEQLPRPVINASKIDQSPILDGNIINDGSPNEIITSSILSDLYNISIKVIKHDCYWRSIPIVF